MGCCQSERHQRLSCAGRWTLLPQINGAIGSRRTEKACCGVRDRGRELRIVWAALYHGLTLDERLIFAVEVEPHFDRHRAGHVKPFGCRRAHKTTHVSCGVGAELKRPFDPIRRGIIRFRWLKAPAGESDLCHVRYEKVQQSRVGQARESVNRLDLQCDRRRAERYRQREEKSNNTPRNRRYTKDSPLAFFDHNPLKDVRAKLSFEIDNKGCCKSLASATAMQDSRMTIRVPAYF